MADPIDIRLTEYAGRWRDALPAPGVELAMPPAPDRRRHWVVLGAAVAVATVIALAVGLRVARPADDSRPVGPTTVAPGEVIPWAELPATAPTIPVTSGSTEPTPADGLPACAAGQLQAVPELNGAGGTMVLSLTIGLEQPGPPCRLEGVPGVEALSHGGPAGIPVQPASGDGPVAFHSGPVVVSEDSSAVIAMSLTTHWCAPPIDNDRLRITLPGGTGSFEVDGFGRLSGCDGIPGSGPQPISVWPVAPQDGSPEPRSAWADVTAEAALDLAGSPGEAVDFVVTLTAAHEVSLRPCPDFTISMYGLGVDEQRSYGLNCGQVPYRDAAGDPVLPAGVPVRFAMRVTAPDRDVKKLIWQLVVPEHTGVGGRLIVS